ncbi:MAG: aminotransferase class I/II-fold pyridoxal phosphate-dependent enzyme, partial [Desulfocucumaceae bacterium]
MGKLIKAPIVDAVKKYIADGIVRFHMPGHKGVPTTGSLIGNLLGDRVFAADVTNVPGMDDLHGVKGVIKVAQELAAGTFGADFTYFLINGSSCGLHTLIMTVSGPGERILIPRNMHRSILSGIILSGAAPVYFKPEYDTDYMIPLGVFPETIKSAVDKHPDLKAVVLVSPTYNGITSDVNSIAQIVHGHSIPLLVDEAHGPHLRFNKKLPQSALECGADASVQGTHKILTAFTQASMLHIKGNMLDRNRLESTLKLLQSTSTSYLLLASLDSARAALDDCGEKLIEKSVEMADYIRQRASKIDGYSVFGHRQTRGAGDFGLDSTKVTISVRDLQVTGFWAEQWLREKCDLQVEMSDAYNILLIVTSGNSQGDADRFLKALGQMRDYINQNKERGLLSRDDIDIYLMPDIPEQVVIPREAFLASD